MFLWPGGPRIANADGVYSVGTDSVLLGGFVGRAAGLGVDLGCGCGILGISVLWTNPGLRMQFIDLQEAAVKATELNLKLNELEERAVVLHRDLRTFSDPNERDRYDLVVANPPYYPVGSGKPSPDPSRALARTELGCTLEDLIQTASLLLKTGGRFCIVHKPERLAELFSLMHHQKLEPKRLQMVQYQIDSSPSLILAEGKKGAKPGLKVEPPLLLKEKETNKL